MRRLSAVVTRWHFAPTEVSRRALLREGYPESQVHVVGNTVIDALLQTLATGPAWPAALRPLGEGEHLVLVTLHRRENFGAPLERILQSLKAFALRHPEARLVYPVHPNPSVLEPANRVLGGLPNVDLIQPLDYPDLVALMGRCRLAFTDSGGIQEEAPALGKPVLVFREVTERPEAVDAGGVLLVGSDPERFATLAESLWAGGETYAAMARPRFPYGDGHAAARIAELLAADLVR